MKAFNSADWFYMKHTVDPMSPAIWAVNTFIIESAGGGIYWDGEEQTLYSSSHAFSYSS